MADAASGRKTMRRGQGWERGRGHGTVRATGWRGRQDGLIERPIPVAGGLLGRGLYVAEPS
eukprot:6273481-Pyramimonas_sp.AAC.1